MFCLVYIVHSSGIHLWMFVVFFVLLLIACINTKISPGDARRWFLWHWHHQHRRDDWP